MCVSLRSLLCRGSRSHGMSSFCVLQRLQLRARASDVSFSTPWILCHQISFPTHAQDQLRAMISSMLKEEMAEMEGHRSLAMNPTFDSLEAKVDAQGQALDT